MNEAQNNDIERLLKQARPAELRDELKERVLNAAREAWIAQVDPVLWRITLRRVVVSAAAAVLIVALANTWSDSAVASWRSPAPARIALDAYDLNDAEDPLGSDILYHPLIGRMVVVRRPPAGGAGALLDYVQRLRDALSQTEQNGASTTEPPLEGRSRLPDLPDRYCCS